MIRPHLCGATTIGVTEPVDMISAFWMVHEVSNRKAFLKELFSLLKPDGVLLIVEPIIHVTKKNFETTLDLCCEIGFSEISHPRVTVSRAVVFIK